MEQFIKKHNKIKEIFLKYYIFYKALIYGKKQEFLPYEIILLNYFKKLLDVDNYNIFKYQINHFHRCLHDFKTNKVYLNFYHYDNCLLFNNRDVFLGLKIKVFPVEGKAFDVNFTFKKGHLAFIEYLNGFKVKDKKNIEIEKIEIITNNLYMLDEKKDFILKY